MKGGAEDSDKFSSIPLILSEANSNEDCEIVLDDSLNSEEQVSNVFKQAWEFFDPDVQSPQWSVASTSNDGNAFTDFNTGASGRALGIDSIDLVSGLKDQDRDSVTAEETETSASCYVCTDFSSGEEEKEDVQLIIETSSKSNTESSVFKKAAVKRGPIDLDPFVLEKVPDDLDAAAAAAAAHAVEKGPLDLDAVVVDRDSSDFNTGAVETSPVDSECDDDTGVADDCLLDEKMLPEVSETELNITPNTVDSQSIGSSIDDQQLLPKITYEKLGISPDQATSFGSGFSVGYDEKHASSRPQQLENSGAECSWRLLARNRTFCRICISAFCIIVVLTLCALFAWPALDDSSAPVGNAANAHSKSPVPARAPAPAPTILTVGPTISNPSGMTPSISQEPNKGSTVAPRQTWLIRTSDSRTVFQDYNGYPWRTDLEFLVASEGQLAYNSTNDLCVNGRSTKPETRHDLYCWGRRGMLEYEIPVSKGHYMVTMRFLTQQQAQVKTIVEGTSRLTDADGTTSDEPFVVSREAKVADGFLSIQIVLNTVLAGMEIHPLRKSANESAASYVPGNLVVQDAGLILSEGLAVKRIAASGERVEFFDGRESSIDFHVMPDAANTYPDPRPGNAGGWIYVSNSEAKPKNRNDGTDQFPGGVGAITFDSMGNIVDYRMLLENTRQNCGGGPTPWGAWISGEEYSRGNVWQVDPTGTRQPEQITMGEVYYGDFESFAYYIPSQNEPQFFMTQDKDDGALRRFIPDNPNWQDPWTILTGNGTLEFLELIPSDDVPNSGTYLWTPDHGKGQQAAGDHFPGAEGIDVVGDQLFFVSKNFSTIFVLDLISNTYTNQTTTGAPLLDGHPDQIERLFDPVDNKKSDLYFTQDGGRYAGISAMNSRGQSFTVLESHEYSDETTGLAFSPDGFHLYFAFQDEGYLFDVTRVDGLPFHEQTLDIKYHNVIARRKKGRRTK